jgi:hypothetical protein
MLIECCLLGLVKGWSFLFQKVTIVTQLDLHRSTIEHTLI